MIQLENVSKTYTLGKGLAVHAVAGLTLEVGRGEFVVIVGRSGSGKTTLLNLAAGLTRPTRGRVCLDGVDLWRLTDQQQSAMRNAQVGFVFQFPSLLPTLTVHENVILPTTFTPATGGANGQRAEAGGRANALLAQVLLADEPTSNLDETTEMDIMGLFRQLHATLGLTILLVTHTRQLLAAGMRAIEMAEGRIVTH